MSRNILLELGLEEVPSRFMRAAMDQLKDRVERWLEAARIQHEGVTTYGTPRRLAVYVHQAAEKQADVHEEVKGPARKIALDENGQWTKAALGFARSQGVEADQFFFKELNGVEYVYANKSSIGTHTADVLAEGLQSIVHAMTFPKNMRWGAHEMRFVRPIRWVVALFGSDIIPIQFTGVHASNVSRGHRFLGNDTIITEASEYVEKLRAQHVLVEVKEREALILKQIEELAEEKKWNIAIKEDLLEEVLFLVEYPTTLFGTFEESFLNIPQDVLITSMREHQRYFPVLDDAGQLLPFFVTVRNGDSKGLDIVAKGNEKVLRARLSDAKFFYQEDQKLAIADCVAKLDNIVYHEELGSLGDKVRRITTISGRLAEAIQTDAETVKQVNRAAAICKFDLVTQMVYEFPELQGMMGEDYALKLGEHESVARAINEHYKPRFAGDPAPESTVGALVSMADKLDTLAGCFALGMIPTGSQDPYALRRQATGIVQLLLERKLPITLQQMFDIATDVLAEAGLMKREREQVSKDLYEFFGLRVKNVLSEQVRYDVVDAVLAAGYNDVLDTIKRGEALMSAVQDEAFKLTSDAFNRVSNLASKAESNEVNADLFEQEEERELYKAWQQAHERYTAATQVDALVALGSLETAITSFFDHVMVMAKDENVKANRLALLKLIAADLNQYADFSKLVWA